MISDRWIMKRLHGQNNGSNCYGIFWMGKQLLRVIIYCEISMRTSGIQERKVGIAVK